jgi:hypothetical protein
MTFLSAYCTTFWRGVLLSSFFWLCLLNLGLWYWRARIEELRALMKRLVEACSLQIIDEE